jgi:glycosyltransferase involved in cell wall biosynthesis
MIFSSCYSSKQKIVFVIAALSGGGAERQLGYLSKFLVEKGYEVVVIFRSEGPAGKAAFQKGVNYIKLKTKGNYNPVVLIELYNILAKIKPDIVQSWIIQSDIYIGVLSLFFRYKWVVREANSGSSHKGLKNKYLREIVLRFADKIIANSPVGYKYWMKTGRVEQILNGFDLKKTSISNNDNTSVFNISDKYILYVGRLEKHKNVGLLISSFAQSKIVNEYRLVICGDGSERDNLDTLVNEFGLVGKVEMLGFQAPSVVQSLMSRASLLCLLSEYEGMPNVVFEAMMQYTPILLSPSPSHKALFSQEFVNYTDDASEACVAKSLDCFIEAASNEIKTMNAYKFASKCSIENMGNKYLKVYKELAGK